MQTSKVSVYSIFLHGMLIAMALAMVRTVQQNRALHQQLNPELEVIAVGTPVKPIAVTDLLGVSRTLAWEETEKERLLLVFNTQCPACKENQTAWRSLHENLGSDAELVGISLDPALPTGTYREEHALPFEVVVAADSESFLADYKISAVPFTAYIGRDGRVRGAWHGGLSSDQIASLESEVSRSVDRG